MRKTLSKRFQWAGERFKNAVTEFITSKEAVPGSFYDFQIETKAGLLHVSPHETWVACRFDDVERAKAVLGNCGRLNPFSGKWNFHFSHEQITTPEPLQFFTVNLERIL